MPLRSLIEVNDALTELNARGRDQQISKIVNIHRDPNKIPYFSLIVPMLLLFLDYCLNCAPYSVIVIAFCCSFVPPIKVSKNL